MTGFRLLGSGGTKAKEKSSPQRPTALVDEVSAPRSFGIRSYLHNFYVSPTAEEAEQIGGAWYLLPPPSPTRGLFVCRLCMIIGLFLLIGGAGSIVVGYTWPHEGVMDKIDRLSIFQDEEGTYYLPNEQIKILLQDPMRYWKTAGFCVFASGAILLAISLLIPTLASCTGAKRLASFISETNSPMNEPPLRIYSQEPGTGPTSGPIPVMEQISKVQPGEESKQSTDLLEEH